MPVGWTKLIISHFSSLKMVILPLTTACWTKRNNAFLEKKKKTLSSRLEWMLIHIGSKIGEDTSLCENLTWCNYLTPVISHYLILWIIYTVTGCFHEIKIILQLLTLATSRQLELHKLYLFVQTLKYLSSSSPVISSGNI